MEAEAGRGCRAVGVVGAWSPRGGRALARSGRDARERCGAALGQAVRVRWARPDVGQASGGRGGRPGQLRPWAKKRGGGP